MRSWAASERSDDLRRMETKERSRLSKFLSLVLRHQPELIGLELDAHGWTDIDELIAKAAAQRMVYTRETIRSLVRESDKQRFALSEDGSRIRANQGHSVEVDLGYVPSEPPLTLFHGTAEKNLDSILEKGLLKGERHHVHLSAERDTAVQVGQRYGKPVVLVVESRIMHAQGIPFFQSANGVWLTEHVPARFLRREPG